MLISFRSSVHQIPAYTRVKYLQPGQNNSSLSEHRPAQRAKLVVDLIHVIHEIPLEIIPEISLVPRYVCRRSLLVRQGPGLTAFRSHLDLRLIAGFLSSAYFVRLKWLLRCSMKPRGVSAKTYKFETRPRAFLLIAPFPATTGLSSWLVASFQALYESP
jgi:hypothetical protein